MLDWSEWDRTFHFPQSSGSAKLSTGLRVIKSRNNWAASSRESPYPSSFYLVGPRFLTLGFGLLIIIRGIINARWFEIFCVYIMYLSSEKIGSWKWKRKYQSFDNFPVGIDFETTLSPRKFCSPPTITGFISLFDKLYIFAFQEVFIRFSLRCG